MKKSVILGISAIALVSGIFYACQKQQNSAAGSTSSSAPTTSSINARDGVEDDDSDVDDFINERPKIRFRWEGGDDYGKACAGEDCGLCPGFCIIFDANSWATGRELSPDEVSAGFGLAGIKLTKNGKRVVMVSFQGNTFDNGDGFVRIKKDYHFAPEWAKLLGAQSVTILAGKYPVVHTDAFPLGRVKFDVISVR